MFSNFGAVVYNVKYLGAVIAQYDVSWHLLGETEENKHISFPGLGPLDYEAGVNNFTFSEWPLIVCFCSSVDNN